MIPLLALLIAYLLGAIPFGYLLVKWKTGADVRAAGSGNIGATNVLRTTGGPPALPLCCSISPRAILAVWIAGTLTGRSPLWMSAAALAVMAGHAYPVFLKFQGRQGGGQLRGRVPVPDAPASGGRILVVFVVMVIWTRHISMGFDRRRCHFPAGRLADSAATMPVVAAAIMAGHSLSTNIVVIFSGCMTVPRASSLSERRNREEPGDYRRRKLGNGPRHRAGAPLSARPPLGL